jgi:hypothetical protein
MLPADRGIIFGNKRACHVVELDCRSSIRSSFNKIRSCSLLFCMPSFRSASLTNRRSLRHYRPTDDGQNTNCSTTTHTRFDSITMSNLPTSEEWQQMGDNIDDTRVPMIWISSAVCLSFTLLAVAFRIAARRIAASGFGKDDWLLFVGFVSDKSPTDMREVCG